MTSTLSRPTHDDSVHSPGIAANIKEITGPSDFQYTGTSALKLPSKSGSNIFDDILTSVFQIGGKLLWPNDNAVLAVGHLNDLIGDKPLFMPLNHYFHKYGGVFKLSFAPVPQATFYVLSDPAAVRHVLKEKTFSFDKGLLAEILQPILGKGLIPADIETWRERRPVLQPGFHLRWLARMTRTFNDCAEVLAHKLDRAAVDGEVVDMEALFNSVSLDIIGKAVFNYDFGSVTSQSPVIKAAYACLKEAEHRSTFLVPYWSVPFLGSGHYSIVPRQREFAGHLRVLNDKLEEMVLAAKRLKHEGDLEMLEKRDYDSMSDPSLLRFLVDLRGGDTTDQQLRDDLMTLLVAGHETTGSLLTWTLFELAQSPEEMRKVQAELDRVLQGRDPTVEDIKALDYLRLVLAEGLRLYPQPPILLRRCLEENTLPRAHGGVLGEGGMQEKGVTLSKGANVFISVWNLHRNPALWDNADKFDPQRWLRRQDPPPAAAGVEEGWKGYAPRSPPGMYPNEVDSDFGFMPFGGGQRKCVGDQFAMMEAVVIMAQVLSRFDLTLATAPEEVGMSTG
eukprot:CAMPEP_0172165816 /NCGR_PEP_ID=MMETSP1050-20130122/8625_1 /TAXON_ID=233186 /ORGANISM="Cryptomonas curvata, Strain CCAP979/52" /LENGTH=561 /DNA_ID=CAMNT_0012836335 /DNA_START=256 /DNA_END=1937 /DNA_ORIENTATION=-